MKTAVAVKMDPQTEKAILEHGSLVLESFHAAYDKDPISRETEFRRGEFSEWRHVLDTIYGRRVAEQLTKMVSDATCLTIPHCGPLADDGGGYLGFDSGCHMYIGKLPPQ